MVKVNLFRFGRLPVEFSFGRGRVLLGRATTETNGERRIGLAMRITDEERSLGPIEGEPISSPDVDALMMFENVESLDVVIGALTEIRADMIAASSDVKTV